MTKQEKLEAYQNRSPSHALSSAIGDLTTALMYAVRADTDLHWLNGADTWLTHAENKIAEYRSFVAALNADDAAVADMIADHRTKVAAACAKMTDEVSA
jgi:hypothetical protein